jgi:RNA polymerase sigma-70 factor (ECF subfamily)
VINARARGHLSVGAVIVREIESPGFSLDARPSDATSAEESSAPREAAECKARLRSLVDRHYDFLWRTVRNFGVEDASVEDVAQQVLCIVARRLADIAPDAEMSFLFATAMRVASEARRAARRRPVVPLENVDELMAIAPSPEELVDERRAHEVLRRVLDAMPIDLRVVFALVELEELTLAQAASLVGIPPGTAASRLRRAREHFQTIVRRLHAEQRRIRGAWK